MFRVKMPCRGKALVLLAAILSARAAFGQVHSGPVSEFSNGPVTSDYPVAAGSGAVSDSRSYSFTHNVESLIGPGIPVHSLSRLQEQTHALQPLPVEDVAAEENGPAEPVPAEQGPVDELVTDVTTEEEIAPEESSQLQPEVETPEPEAVEPTPGEELSGETQPEDEGAEAEAPPEFTPTPQREMPQPRSIPGHAGHHAIGSRWVAKSTTGM